MIGARAEADIAQRREGPGVSPNSFRRSRFQVAILALGILLAIRSAVRSFRSARPVASTRAGLGSLPQADETTRERQEATGIGARRLAWEVIQTFLLALAVFLAIRSVVDNFHVEGPSMAPTLEAGQFLLINKAAYFRMDGTPLEGLVPSTPQGSVEYLFGGPRRGDVVVFHARMGRNRALVKRVIGLPDDEVLIKDGQVFVNGELLYEPYVHFALSDDETYPEDGQPLQVPDGSYFVLGDNRPESSDSREGWFVPVENLVGRAWLSYWPPGRWGVVP